jgi:GDP/UDP-N,N'-diacetylbacillosamine 2-epimerase (hydrolysing)
MKVAVLTSSRADYSIYYPLLKKLQSDSFYSLSVIAFGAHLSESHGFTVRKIEEDGFDVMHALRTFPEDDSPGSIVRSMAKTMTEFSQVWERSNFDIVFCLGDRYEMFAACSSSTPFNIKLAHIHGGEQTLGAIDDAFRHSITHMSRYHFTAAEIYREKVIELKGSIQNIYNVGSLSIDNLKNLNLYDISEFKERFGIDLEIPSILITFHPETVSFEKNEFYINELVSALEKVEGYQFIITMPNADTMGNLIRLRLNNFIEKTTHAIGVESFGTLGYLSCMKHSSFMLGNTSSGYIEASFFPKYVIDLGNRQTGRIVSGNINRCNIVKEEILESINKFKEQKTSLSKIEIYGQGNTAGAISTILKGING